MSRHLEILFIIIAIIGLYMHSIREAFTLSNPGKVSDKLPLSDWYPTHKPQGELSDLTMESQYINYPVFPADSHNINNLRQWRKPNNGKCSPPDLCGSLYDKRQIIIPPQPENPGFNDGVRVNFYNIC